MRYVLPLLCFAGVALAAPLPPSQPDDPDLRLGANCSGAPDADDILAALPPRLSELVVLWPRAGATKSAPCRSVGRLSIVDHRGLLLTLSFVFGDVPTAGYRPWFPNEGDDRPSPDRNGPPRNEYVWVPRNEVPMHVVLAGSPSTSEENFEGATSFLERGDVLEPLLSLATH